MEVPVNKNEEIWLEIDDLGSEGQGVGHIDGYAVFVEGALAGERVRVHVIKAGASYGVGKLLEVGTESPDRVRPPCELSARCGGCQLLHMEYGAQLEFKRGRVVQALKRIGGIEEARVLPCLGMDEPFRYRNKGAFVAGRGERGLTFGLYAMRSHRFVEARDCLVQSSVCSAIIDAVSAAANKLKLSAYDEATGKGDIRHLMIRSSSLGEVMVILVINGKKLRGEAELVRAICESGAGVSSILACENQRRTNVILDGRIRLLWGSETIRERLCGLTFDISAKSFFQVNRLQAEALFSKVVEYAELCGDQRVLDAYCGTGTIALVLAGDSAEVVGVETVREAVDDAVRAAEANGIENTRFIAGKAEEEVLRLVGAGARFDVAVVDPPRKGCDEALLRAFAEAKVGRVVYVSCNVATLARDVRVLTELGYEFVEAAPVDMFCHSAHVETVVLLSISAGMFKGRTISIGK